MSRLSLALTLITTALLAALLSVPTAVHAHSRLLSPPTRFGGFCARRDEVCPPCGFRDKDHAKPENTVYARGQQVPMVWPRNNHAGGFVSFSIVPFDWKQTFEEFDANIVQFNCNESGCRSGYPEDLYGEDPKWMGENENKCSAPLEIPDYLPDGQYSVKWQWFAVGNWFGDYNRGHTDYYGCHDFTIRGGRPYNPASRPACPRFIPGDAHNPPERGVCKYFGSGYPMQCRDGCHGKFSDGIPAQLRDCLNVMSQGVGVPESATDGGRALARRFVKRVSA